MGLSRVFLSSFIAAALLFYAFPELDIRFSMFFYDPVSRFYLADAPFCRWIYESVEIVSIVWGFLLFCCWLHYGFEKKTGLDCQPNI